MLTRRDRLERIAAAERDRRAGRVELAIAALGDGSEWPARVVLALARLPEDEGSETREILQASLDTWAAEAGLAPLGDEATDSSPVDAPRVVEEPSYEVAILDTPIEPFELEEAFSRAEAQVDEMHDVNRVAERVLMDEPLGLSELSDEPVDAAWASASVWPTAEVFREATGVLREATGALDEAEGGLEEAVTVEGEDGVEKPSRTIVLATLERWLVNLEKNSARRAQ